jgi:hypothetical protein
MPLDPSKKQLRPPPWFTSHRKELQVHEPDEGQPGSAQHAPVSWSEAVEHVRAFDCDAESEKHMQKSGSLWAGQ